MEATNAVGEDPYYRTVPKKIPTDKEMQEIKEHIRKMKVNIKVIFKINNILLENQYDVRSNLTQKIDLYIFCRI